MGNHAGKMQGQEIAPIEAAGKKRMVKRAGTDSSQHHTKREPDRNEEPGCLVDGFTAWYGHRNEEVAGGIKPQCW